MAGGERALIAISNATPAAWLGDRHAIDVGQHGERDREDHHPVARVRGSVFPIGIARISVPAHILSRRDLQ
jgi:hypothetical protein